ncbi:PEP-CTERM sorting domain-containing protein [Roseateles sp. PN1]|uniref:PEP-CTERM sorting domain-containing protein n=1 Tax=Roseateles sp. PN1 TaxID=3137372 RepID=UPI00313995EE
MKHYSTMAMTAGLALALMGSKADAAVTWTITDLGSAQNVQTMALNDQGWVVLGNRILSPTAGGYTVTELFNAQGNANNFALYGINNSNAVIGVDRNAGSAQAFVWQAGSRTNLPQLANWAGYSYSEVRQINAKGQVIGNTGDGAAIWSPDGSGGYAITELNKWSTGSAINDAGMGLMSNVNSPTASFQAGYSNGVGATTFIPERAGFRPAGAAINNSNTVAGAAFYEAAGYSWNQTYVWQGSTVTPLPVSATAANWQMNVGGVGGINEANVIVGYGSYGPYDERAMMWTQGALGWNEIDLNTVSHTGASFGKLTQARDINESGQILGAGDYFDSASGQWSQHIFLLTPVPEPASAALLLVGMLSLIGLIRQRQRGA